MYSDQIDAGNIEVSFKGFVRSSPKYGDFSQIVIEYRDGENQRVLNTFDSEKIRNMRGWEKVKDSRFAPKGTRWARVRLVNSREIGTSNDGYYDELSLKVCPREEKPGLESNGASNGNGSASVASATKLAEAEKEAGIARLKKLLVEQSWNYVDNLYPPGGPIRFYPDGKFHDRWKWNYWVVGPKTMHVQFWDPKYDQNKAIIFAFNDDLTRFDAQFEGHLVTGTRIDPPKAEEKGPGSVGMAKPMINQVLVNPPEFEVLIQKGIVVDGRFDDYSDYRPAWKTESDELTCVVPGDKMLSFGSKAYRDFQFEAEYKVTGPRGAVFIAHSEHRGDRPKGYSVGLGGSDSGLTVAGAIFSYAYKSGNIRSLFVGDIARNPKPDEWASLEVTMKGNEITAKINGIVVGKATEANLDYPNGRVAFAVMPDSRLTLRHVRVRELTDVDTKIVAGKSAGERAIVRLDGMDYTFRWCPAGSFKMGSAADDAGHLKDEGPVNVTISKGFWTLETEVTQAMWVKVMGTEPWKEQATVKPGDNYPATFVNFADSTTFCGKLTESARRAGILSVEEQLRLPTEAEWEYACRAGAATSYSFGNDANQLGDYAWWDGNTKTERYAHLVGTKKSNLWGLYDMHGNVWEWCADWYTEKLVGGADPTGPVNSSPRSNLGGGWNGPPRSDRGGSWVNSQPRCRAALRGWFPQDFRLNDLGFRVVCNPGK